MDPQTSLMQNPGSPGWAAGAAFAGRVVGGIPGLIVGSAMTDDEGKAPVSAYVVRWLGQIGGAAGGAALGAPPELKARAAVGAAIGGAVPLVGAPLAAVGAYIATRPKDGREANPMSPMATVALVTLGLAAAGGLTYVGVKAWKAREAKKEAEATPANDDDWGWDLNRYELWGLGPVDGIDGKEYFYRIYRNLEEGTYELAYVGETGSGGEGPFDTSEEAVWCVENRLPQPCVGYPGPG